MSTPTVLSELLSRRCKPLPKGTTALFPEERAWLQQAVPEWKLSADGSRIRRELRTRDFRDATTLFGRIAELADAEDHHPDLHLTEWNRVTIELWTHTVGGLSENDFIVAAKIDRLLA